MRDIKNNQHKSVLDLRFDRYNQGHSISSFWKIHALAKKCLPISLLWIVAGCATPQDSSRQAIFFPPAPHPPRLQYLTSFSGSNGFERENRFLTFLLGKAPPTKNVIKPYGITTSQGKIFVCDTVARNIAIFDLSERKVSYFIPKGPGRLLKPINMAVDEDGTRYVADPGRGDVVIFDNEGTYLSALGGTQNIKPTDVVISGDRLYVTDLHHKHVKVFDKTQRTLLFTIPRKEEKEADKQLYSPVNVTVDSNGHLWVSDLGAFQVQVYDTEGHYLRTIGQAGTSAGEFVRPKGLATDHEDRLYIVDAATQVVQIFDKKGQLLLFFGQPDGSDASLVLPADIWIDYDHVHLFQDLAAPNFQLEYLALVSNQYGGRKISVFGFGHEK